MRRYPSYSALLEGDLVEWVVTTHGTVRKGSTLQSLRGVAGDPNAYKGSMHERRGSLGNFLEDCVHVQGCRDQLVQACEALQARGPYRQGLIELHIVQCQRRLIGKGMDEPSLLRMKHPTRAVCYLDGTYDLVLDAQWYGEYTSIPALHDMRPHFGCERDTG